MRKFIVPIFLALVTVAPGAAFAANAAPAATAAMGDQTTSGVVKKINLTARSLELADGSWYYLPSGFKAPDTVKEGSKVTVHWHTNGSAHDVTAIDLG